MLDNLNKGLPHCQRLPVHSGVTKVDCPGLNQAHSAMTFRSLSASHSIDRILYLVHQAIALNRDYGRLLLCVVQTLDPSSTFRP